MHTLEIPWYNSNFDEIWNNRKILPFHIRKTHPVSRFFPRLWVEGKLSDLLKFVQKYNLNVTIFKIKSKNYLVEI